MDNRIHAKEQMFLWLTVAMPNEERNEVRQPYHLFQTFYYHQTVADQRPSLSIYR